MTKKEFIDSTADLPDDSKLIFCSSNVYLGDELIWEEMEYEVGSLDSIYENNQNYIFLYEV